MYKAKKNLYNILLTTCMISSFFSFSSFASNGNATGTTESLENTSIEETEESEHDQEDKAESEQETEEAYNPYFYDESNNEESIEETDESGNGFHGYHTYEEYLDSIRQETLSPQQIENGYILSNDGIPLSPEEQEGDPGEGIDENGVEEDVIKKSPPPVNGVTASVTFRGALPEGVHDSIMIKVVNIYTYQSYLIYLEEYDNLSTTWNLPDGTYMVEALRLQHDTEGQYAPSSASTDNFIVRAGTAMIVNVGFENGPVQETTAAYEDSSEEESTETYSNTNIEQHVNTPVEKDTKEQKKPLPFPVQIIILTALMIIPIIIIILFIRIWEKHRQF